MTDGSFAETIDPSAGGAGLGRARDNLRAWLSRCGVPEPALHEILIACGEACANAVEHSGARMHTGRPGISVTATRSTSGVQIVVADHGAWKIAASEPSVPSGGRGRGRMMMAALVDHLDIRTGPDGTTVELIKELP
ncbi:MAG TPA: ATP-binding protein [Sporichthyaceae bacterium]|jgi:anti-sigma regulatory factor (Ser/Thr protein kinase)|nr:ATP-binding protein [Sporichthyaceae bacterium]